MVFTLITNSHNVSLKWCLVIFVIFCSMLMLIYNSDLVEKRSLKAPRPFRKAPHPFRKRMKYILQWSGNKLAPFNFMGEGNSAFIQNKCTHTNCFVTDNASYLNLTEFDAIAFNGRNVIRMKLSELPKSRSQKQKYIFGATESADRFPACNKVLDNFFNWTWTYKLSSTFRFGYITIYDLEGNVVGPAINMKWPNYMKPIGEDLKTKLASKSKAAAWFVSHCNTLSKREDFIAKVNEELKKFGWAVDIYGSCGKSQCPRNSMSECEMKVKKEYFFYFSFENSFSEDYVTEKILTALDGFAVPVVYGSANYSRFLPPDSYLNAIELGPHNLARAMDELIKDKERYYNFFRWRNHFTYKQTTGAADICKLCEVLNDEQMFNSVSVWKDFRKWWNSPRHAAECLCCY